MRIALLTQSYPPMISGASLFVLHLAKGLTARGHDCLVIAASDTGKPYIQQENRLTIVRLASFPNPVRARQHFILWAYKEIYRELQNFQPDVIHMHDLLTVGLAGVFAGNRLGVPITLTTHQLPWFVTSYLPDWPYLRRFVETALWKYAQWLDTNTYRFISPTPTIAQTVESYTGICPAVIGYGLDSDRFTPQPSEPGEREALCNKFGVDPARPIILHVGRLDVDKQVHLVIEAAAKAMQTTNAQFLVIGDGAQRDPLIHLAAQCGIADRVYFPGFANPNGDLPGLYRMASVFVTASEIETQGLVLLEAMASGVPVVAVRATCIPEVVHDGLNGCLVEPKDVNGMAARIVALLAAPNEVQEMGRVARAVAERHSSTRMFAAHEGLYTEMATNNVTNPAISVPPMLRKPRRRHSFFSRFMDDIL